MATSISTLLHPALPLPSVDPAGQLPAMPAINETNDPTKPRTCELQSDLSQDLQRSLESTIRDLRRELDQRNGFIDHLESSLQAAHSEQARLDDRLKNATKDLRAAHNHIHVSEDLVSRDRDDLVDQIRALQKETHALRDANDSLRTAAKHQDTDTLRNESLLDQERAARDTDRHRYQRLVDLAEERLELLASELTTLRSQHQPPSTHPLPPTNDDSLPQHQHHQAPARADPEPTRDSFLPPAQSMTLADELDASSISSLEDDPPHVQIRHSLLSNSDALVSPDIQVPAASQHRDSDYFAISTSPSSLPRPTDALHDPPEPVFDNPSTSPSSLPRPTDALHGPPEPVFDNPSTSPLLYRDTFSTPPPSADTQADPMPAPEVPREPRLSSIILGPAPYHYTNASTQTDDFTDLEMPRLGQARRVSLRPLQLPVLAIRTSSGRLTPTSPRRSVTAGSPPTVSPLSDTFKRTARPHRASTRFPTKQRQPSASPSATAIVVDDNANGDDAGVGAGADNDADEDAQDARPAELSRQLLDELRLFSEKADRTLALGLTDYISDLEVTRTLLADGRTQDKPVRDGAKATPRVDSLADLHDAMQPAAHAPSTPRRYRSDPALRITTDLVNAPMPPIQVPSRRSSRGMTITGPHANDEYRRIGATTGTRRPQQREVADVSSEEELMVPRSRGASKAALWNAQRADGMQSRRRTRVSRPHASSTASESTWNGGLSTTAPTETMKSATVDDTKSKELLIDAIASTMLGEWMWKAPRKRRPSLDLQRGGNKQKRWIWISLEQRTIMWSAKQPKTESALASTPGRTLPIQTILDVKDTERGWTKAGEAAPFARSIVVQTPERNLKFNAPDAERHYAWLMSLSYVANPTQMPGVPRVPLVAVVPGLSEKSRGPRLRKRSLTRLSSAATLGEAASRAVSSPALAGNNKSMLARKADAWEDDDTGYATSDGEGLAPETREAIASIQTETESWMATPSRRVMARISSLSTLQSQTTSNNTPKAIETPLRGGTTWRHGARRGSLPMAGSNYDWIDGRAVADMVDKIGTVEMTAHADPGGVTYRPAMTSLDEHPPRSSGRRHVWAESQDEGEEKRQGQQLFAYDPAKDDVFGGF